MAESPFSTIPPSEWVAHNDLAFAVRDRHGVSKGHTLVISRRVVATWFDASREEQLAILSLIDEVKRALDEDLHPDGYNVGFNAGEAAGQTVMHLHVHVIPRSRGDMDDPRGGVRHVIPSKGNYLRDARPMSTGGEGDPFARHVLPLFDRADDIAIVAAFVQESGLRRIRSAVHGALGRGARIRLITGDYLQITQASALGMLVDWQSASRMADEDGGTPAGTLEARVVEVDRLPGRTRSFHPKSWRFQSARFGIAFVGSSNLSLAALDTGIEWNLRVDRDGDARAYDRIVEAFEAIWASARPLDAAWVDDYAERAREAQLVAPVAEVEPEVLEPPPEPHEAQREALDALRTTRGEGRRRALVVLPTGLGKTWLAAFDYAQLCEEMGGSPRPRLLFLAHRKELLRQAADAYRRLLRDEKVRIGWCVDEQSNLSADLVFASVQKLAHAQYAQQLAGEHFDYVVVDEVHHAAARSYRRILKAIDPDSGDVRDRRRGGPAFLLGLTATPERADDADILGLFDDHIAYRTDIRRGIELGRLVPFHYFGVKDDIDYDNIPWRNRRFDTDALAAAAQTEARMATLWRAWQAHAGTRTLVFCCSVAHAVYVRAQLRERNLRVAAVFSGEGADDRDASLEAFKAGQLDALCAVDVFNEGVDVPAIDRVVMLRPTESSVVFLQQLGRGLRASEGKRAVTVIDFVGNHAVFLQHLRTLLSLAGSPDASGSLYAALKQASGQELPGGCSVELELEAKDMLERLLRVGGADEVERAYRELRAERGGERPTAGELLSMGYRPSTVRDRYGGWFGFVRAQGDLGPTQQRVLESLGPLLREIETTEMTKCFKMVALQALLDADALPGGMAMRDLARRSFAILKRSPDLLVDLPEEMRTAELDDVGERAWLAYWRRNPMEAWTSPKKDRRTWFKLEGDRFVLDAPIEPAAAEELAAMIRELIDYRLAQYRRRLQPDAAEGFVCAVTWNQRDPILKLPRGRAQVPDGEAEVRVPDGSVWVFRFAKEFCNVARPAGSSKNQLPELLRRWFGPSAGQPGTAFEVRFRASPDALWAEPLQGSLIALRPRLPVATYRDLRAAAGHAHDAIDAASMEHERETVLLPVERADANVFAVRVLGTSMDGGVHPMRDGDWAVLRVARGESLEALRGRVVLAELPGDAFGNRYQIKRIAQRDGGWWLSSDNPDGPTLPAPDELQTAATLERTIRPEDLAPATGTLLGDDELAARFGLPESPTASGRYGGHLFVLVDHKGMLEAPDRVSYVPKRAWAGETAFVLARHGDIAWRYLGVGRWREDDSCWHIPEVDFPTWRTWGEGRSASRSLPAGALVRARMAVDAVLAQPERERALVRRDGRRARVLGSAAEGGVRIDGGDGGFAARTVSLLDVAWVAAADEDVHDNGGQLDEGRVNRLRYLEGTPKGSTRWIDTGWAISLWERGRELAEPEGALRIHRDDGRELDASFRVERRAGALTVVVEARGGTRGSEGARNTDYNEGLETLLARLKVKGALVADALVESGATEQLGEDERRIYIEGREYPVAIEDPSQLRREIGAAQARVARRAGAKGGGNQTRRIRLVLRFAGDAPSPGELARALQGSR